MQSRDSLPKMRGLRSSVAVLLLALVLVGVAGCQSVDPGNPIGSILQGLTNDLDTVIKSAGAQAQATTLSAAGAVEEAINNAESSFAKDLGTGINQVSDAEKNAVLDLETYTRDVQKGTLAVLKAATASAQQLLNTLPFTNLNPQVTSYSPLFMAATSQSGSPIEVTVNGNFFWAFQQKLTPLMKAGGITYQPNLNTTQQLGFSLPASAFSATSSKSFLPVSLELTAPYHEGHIFQSVQPGVFHLLVTVLPPSPVTSLTLVNQVPLDGIATHTVIEPAGASSNGGGWSENSFDCQPHTITESFSSDPNWTIVPSSAQVVYTFNKNPGGAPPPSVLVQTTKVTIIVSVLPSCTCVFICVSDGSGDITFYLTYTQQQPTHSVTPVTTQLTMHWGDQLVEPVTRGQWHLSADIFNGNHVEFSGSDNSNPYLTVFDLGTSTRISTPAPDALNQ